MSAEPVSATNQRRVVLGLPFVQGLARRLASSMSYSVEIGDLIQEGVLGLIDAAHRFDEARGIKFETFAERRVRGAMIDALRRDAWPRGLRRQRRDVDTARDALWNELGHQPSMADLAARVGLDERRLVRTIVRIHTIEATSPLATRERVDEHSLPTVLKPSSPDSPDRAYEKSETRQRIRRAMALLPAREQRVIGLYYYDDVTMKDIGVAIGVNESRVSQLHARAIGRLRAALGDERLPAAGMPGALTTKEAARPKIWPAQAPRASLPATPPQPNASSASSARSAQRTAPERDRILSARRRT